MRIALAFLAVISACHQDPNPAVDASLPTPDAPPDAKPDAPPVVREGLIALNESTNMGTAESNVDVTFVTGSVWGTMVGSDGPCTAYEDPPSEGISAGTLSITGTTSAVTVSPTGTAPNVDYATASTPPANLYNDGATITVQAAGAEFAAFSTSIVAPAAIAGFTPPTMLNRTSGTTLTWTAGAGPKALVFLIGFNTHLRIVLCRVNDTGSYTLSASNLALLPPGSTSSNGGVLAVGRLAESTVATSSGSVSLLVMSTVQGDVTFTL